jgi:Met-zincin
MKKYSSSTSHFFPSGVSMNQGTTQWIVLAVLASVVAIGCGEAIEIDRTQPNKTKKSDLVDEWYYRATIVDKQFHTDNVFVGLQGEMDRIKWEVTESQLIGVRSYERTVFTDGSNPGEQNVVVAFPIESHFDVRRDYNPTNGVETNVVIEDTQTRPWWERDFIRVIWSSNLADTLDLGEWGTFSGGGQNGVRRFADDASSPWKVRFEKDYIETTIDGVASPDWRTCYYLDAYSPCNAASVKMKMSFLKVKANDYQAMDYPDGKAVAPGGLYVFDGDDDVTNNRAVLAVTAGNSGLPPDAPALTRPRFCSVSEMDNNNRRTMNLIDDPAVGLRVCNDTPLSGDDLGACRPVLVTCLDVQTGLRPRDALIAIDPEFGTIPCDLASGRHEPGDCQPITTDLFGRFGFFRTDRYQRDRENGFQYDGRQRLINRWNIWQESTDATGEVLPMAKRAVKPVVYYTNVAFPSDLQEDASFLAAEWDQAYRGAVAAARGVKVTDLPQNLNDNLTLRDGTAAPVIEKMYEIRQNDCNIENVNGFAEEYDLVDALRANSIQEVTYGNLENACAVLEHETKLRVAGGLTKHPVFHWQQLGDLRYSFVAWTNKAELAGPLGYGPSASDPITGEIVSANANIYGTSVDTYANWGGDIVDLLNDRLTTQDVLNGTAAREHVEGVRRRYADRVPQAQLQGFLDLFESRTSHMSDAEYLTPLPLTSMNSGLKQLRESGLEDEFLMTSEAMRLFGNDAQAPLGTTTARMIENARPSNMFRKELPLDQLTAQNGSALPGALDAFKARSESGSTQSNTEELADLMGRQNFCFLAQQTEPAIADLAVQLKDQPRDEVVRTIRKQVFRGVMAHEIGHTLGLRHNFEGSADTLNYFPDYWDLGEDALPPEQQHLYAKNGVGSWQDKRAVQYSTIMDYHQRFNSDWAGIGMYDKAAIKLGYSETVEVFDESQEQFAARSWFGNIFLLDPKDLPALVGGSNVGSVQDADSKLDEDYFRARAASWAGDLSAVTDFSAAIPGKPKNIFRRRDIPLSEYFRNDALQQYGSTFPNGPTDILLPWSPYDDGDCTSLTSAATNAPGCMANLMAQLGATDDRGQLPALVVPYSYCSDAFAGGGNLTCNRFDMGNTSRDIVANASEMYDFYYPFDAFRRDRVLNPFISWTNSYINRLNQRTYQPMLNSFQYFYFYGRAGGLRFFPKVRDWGEAALRGLNFFGRVLQQPEPGKYCKDGDSYVAEADAASCAESIDLGLGQGRLYNSNWDKEYQYQPTNIGNYWDKALAIQIMTDSSAFFFRDFSTLTNRGAFSIGYYRVFQEEMLQLFGALIRGDKSVYSARVSVENGTAQVNYLPFLRTGVYGEPLEDADVAGTPIVPGSSYQLRYWAALFGTYNLSSTIDRTLDFATRTRITRDGASSDPVVTEDADGDDANNIETIQFRDPQTNYTYNATKFDSIDASIGFGMLKEAKDFVEGEFAAASAALANSNSAENRRRVEIAAAKLNEKVQMIDFMVRVGNMFEYPG